MARSYRKSFIETAGVEPNLYAHKIFCSWDFSISNSNAAQLKHNSIYNELQEIINDLHHASEKPTRLQAFWTFTTQCTAHVLVFCMLGGLGLGLWALLQIIGDLPVDSSSFAALYVTFIVNITLLVLQTVFAWIAGLEDYKSAKLSLHVTLFRNYLLEMLIVGVLLVFWLTRNYTGVCYSLYIFFNCNHLFGISSVGKHQWVKKSIV